MVKYGPLNLWQILTLFRPSKVCTTESVASVNIVHSKHDKLWTTECLARLFRPSKVWTTELFVLSSDNTVPSVP